MLVFVYYETMYVDIVPNRTSPPAVLLRESRREGGKIVKTTLANLSTCPPEGGPWRESGDGETRAGRGQAQPTSFTSERQRR